MHWDYWLARWGSLTRDERRNQARQEMLPLLLRRPPPPADPPSPPRSTTGPPLAPDDPGPGQPSREDTIRNLRSLAATGTWTPEDIARAAKLVGLEWPPKE